MENFGYLEMAIAQENCSKNQPKAQSKPAQTSPTPQPQPKSLLSEAAAQDFENAQVVGWFGLF